MITLTSAGKLKREVIVNAAVKLPTPSKEIFLYIELYVYYTCVCYNKGLLSIENHTKQIVFQPGDTNHSYTVNLIINGSNVLNNSDSDSVEVSFTTLNQLDQFSQNISQVIIHIINKSGKFLLAKCILCLYGIIL